MKRKRIFPVLLAALCLTLALPAAAAETDPAAFTDAASIEHWDAVAALAKLGIVAGRDDGSFHPTDPVRRSFLPIL